VTGRAAATLTICGAGLAACAVVLADVQGLEPLLAARAIAVAGAAALLLAASR